MNNKKKHVLKKDWSKHALTINFVLV